MIVPRKDCDGILFVFPLFGVYVIIMITTTRYQENTTVVLRFLKNARLWYTAFLQAMMDEDKVLSRSGYCKTNDIMIDIEAW